MSGLLERIARRRTPSARSENGVTANGAAGPDASHLPVALLRDPEPEPTLQPAPSLQPAPIVHPAPILQPAPLLRPAPEPEPAPEPLAPEATPAPEPPLDFRHRGRLLRRARYLRRLREVQLRDLGGFVVELHRAGRERPELVSAKVAVAAATADELGSLEQALADGRVLREVREAGIGGACPECGAVHGSTDRFCASCGHRLEGRDPDRVP
jgi:hypothetical protein